MSFCLLLESSLHFYQAGPWSCSLRNNGGRASQTIFASAHPWVSLMSAAARRYLSHQGLVFSLVNLWLQLSWPCWWISGSIFWQGYFIAGAVNLRLRRISITWLSACLIFCDARIGKWIQALPAWSVHLKVPHKLFPWEFLTGTDDHCLDLLSH